MRGMVTLFLVIFVASVAPAQTVNDQIAKAWGDRQARVKSAEFRVSATGFYPKGGMTHGLPPDEKKKLGVLPAADTETTWSQTVVLDGRKFRMEAKGTQWAGDGFRYQESTVVLDGTFRRSLDIGYFGNTPRGLVSKERDYFEAKFQSVKPISRTFRGVAPGFRSFFVDDLKGSGVKTIIGGRTCEQFILRRERGARSEYWLDPQREWLLAREVYVVPGRDRTQLDIQYDAHPVAGWVPKTWEFRHTLDERVPMGVEKYTVTSYEINPSIPESAFELPFPVGANVTDMTAGRKDYVVEEGGRERILLDITKSAARRWWVYAMWGLGVVMVIAVWFVRRRSRAASPAGGETSGTVT